MKRNKEPIRIAIADDHEMIRTALRLMLEKESALDVVLEVSSLRELFDIDDASMFDVLLLDLNLEDSSGITTIERVRSVFEKPAILVLSAYPEEEFAKRAFRAGANGYLHKSLPPHELTEAIRTVTRKKYYITASLETILPVDITSHPQKEPSLSKLSAREFEVLRMIAGGMNNKEIAAQLHVSPKTVSTYKSRLMEKLELESAAQLYMYATRYGLNMPI